MLIAKANLAKIYSKCGKDEEAERLLKECLDKQKSVLGNHPQTFFTMKILADLYSKQSKHAETENILKICLDAQKSVLGEDSNDTLMTTMDLFKCYLKQDKTAEFQKLVMSVSPATLALLNSMLSQIKA